MVPVTATERHVVPLGEATRAWASISLQTFGGPAGQIAVMQRELVDERRWIGERRFLHALSYCMLLPGPEAQQLAVYTGWLLNGWLGGLIAGVLFVLPGAVALLGLSWLYAVQGDTALVAALFLGLAPAVLAIVAQAVLRVGRRALTHPVLVAVAAASFVALTFLGVAFPVVVLAAGITGWVLERYRPGLLAPRVHDASVGGVPPVVADDALHRAAPSTRRNLVILFGGVLVWLLPVAVAAVATGADSVYTEQGLFFSGSALVTFGGAYAVLAFVAQRAVEVYGWVSAGEMVRGLALAESTPGPLIMVVQFVAFLGAYRDPGGLDPVVAGLVASLLTIWVTFVPSFLFIYLGAPYVERLRGQPALGAALAGITAAVVGVIASLGLYFATNTLFEQTRTIGVGVVEVLSPVWSTYVWETWVIAAVAAVLIFRLGWSVLRTLGACALLGVALGLAF